MFDTVLEWLYWVLEFAKENPDFFTVSATVILTVSGSILTVLGFRLRAFFTRTDSVTQDKKKKKEHLNENEDFSKKTHIRFHESLHKRLAELEDKYSKVNDESEKQEINNDIRTVTQMLMSPGTAFDDYLELSKEANKLPKKLSELSKGIEDPRLDKAKQALEEDKSELADSLLSELIASEKYKNSDDIMATFCYAKGLIASREFRWVEAENLYKKALEIRRRALGEDHPSTASSYNNVAYNLNAQGKYDEAEPLFRKALDIRRKVLGEEHPSTAVSYNNVAANLDAQGKHDEAEPFHRKALDILRKVFGEEHPGTATSYNNVAANLDAQRKHDEAEPLYRKALDIRRKVFGEDHHDTAASYNNVASNLNRQKKYDEAKFLYRKALDIFLKVFGEDHSFTATSYNNVGFNLNAQGKHSEAETLFRRALEIRRRVLREDHPHTASSYHNLAMALNAQDKYEEAENLSKKALEIYRQRLGEHHFDTKNSYSLLKEIQENKKKHS